MLASASFLTLLFALLAGHALGDYPLQGDFLARAKNHLTPIVGVPWYQALTAHALIQAGFVAAITGSLYWGSAEFACHWIIDRTKCEGAISYNVDQAAHVLCKLLWALAIVAIR